MTVRKEHELFHSPDFCQFLLLLLFDRQVVDFGFVAVKYVADSAYITQVGVVRSIHAFVTLITLTRVCSEPQQWYTLLPTPSV